MTSSRSSKATRRGQCMTRTACELCREKRAKLHRRDYLLDAVCATAGNGNYALGILRSCGLTYDEVADMAASNQSSFVSDQSSEKPDLLQQQMDSVQSTPWAGSAPEVRSAITPFSAQACHPQSRTTCMEEAKGSSNKLTKTKRPRRAGSKVQKQADTAVRATLSQDGFPKVQQWKATERSRMASNKCRKHKRGEVSTLASREQAMNIQNRELSKLFNTLQAEVFTLKAQLLQHTDCSCVLIQSYVASEVEKSVDKFVTGPAALLPFPATATGSDLQAASSTSAGAESTNMQSLMMAAPGEWRQSPWMDGLATGPNVVPAQKLDDEQHKQATAPVYYPLRSPLAEPLIPQPDWNQMTFGGVQYSNVSMNDVSGL
ncbi:hypothetical protein CC79DRAFT_1317493 [Sarocladium strictum]